MNSFEQREQPKCYVVKIENLKSPLSFVAGYFESRGEEAALREMKRLYKIEDKELKGTKIEIKEITKNEYLRVIGYGHNKGN